ncbi:MAG: hypothetical protein LBE85_11325 [Candidatus Accumulibacter sp.]|jgi:hypothetical protein|nr:hypothetical protein [Accumulibacter sp.]
MARKNTSPPAPDDAAPAVEGAFIPAVPDAAPEPAPRRVYRVRGMDLDHDGQRFPEGAEIELDAPSAARLQAWLTPMDTTKGTPQ